MAAMCLPRFLSFRVVFPLTLAAGLRKSDGGSTIICKNLSSSGRNKSNDNSAAAVRDAVGMVNLATNQYTKC